MEKDKTPSQLSIHSPNTLTRTDQSSYIQSLILCYIRKIPKILSQNTLIHKILRTLLFSL